MRHPPHAFSGGPSAFLHDLIINSELNFMNASYVYILSSGRNGTLYTGVTNNLVRRVWEHKSKLAKGFTLQYDVDKLVYYEEYQDIIMAIQREKRLKKWLRKWKISLIEKNNPYWQDLFDQLST